MCDASTFRESDLRFNCGDDPFGHLILQTQYIHQWTIDLLGPNIQTAQCVAQLNRYPDAAANLPNATF